MGGTYGAALGFGASAYGAYLSAKEAKRQRKFQERMAKTKYQYTMEDMKTAGLNPILAYQGIGGGTPQGAMGHVPDFGSAMAKGGESAVRVQKGGSEKGLIDQQTANARQTEKLIKAQTDKTTTEGTTAMWHEAAARFQLPQQSIRAQYYKGRLGTPSVYLQEGGHSARAAASAIGALGIGIRGMRKPRGRSTINNYNYGRPRP